MIILFDYIINIPINFILEHLILTTYHLAVCIYLTIHPSIDISLYTYFSFAFIFCWNVITQQIYENFMTEEIYVIQPYHLYSNLKWIISPGMRTTLPTCITDGFPSVICFISRPLISLRNAVLSFIFESAYSSWATSLGITATRTRAQLADGVVTSSLRSSEELLRGSNWQMMDR